MPRNSINAYLIDGYLVDAVSIRSSFGRLYKKLKNREIHPHILTHAHADHQGISKQICQHWIFRSGAVQPEKLQAESGHLSFFRPKGGVLIVSDTPVNMNLLPTVPSLHLPPGFVY